MDYKFSVITSNYNKEKYTANAIKSVLHQTYPNWEMIIVDDCSTDRSVEIIQNYVKNDSRIKLFFHDKNMGIAQTKHDAIVHATGDIMAILDGDDLLSRKALAVMNKAYNKYPEDFIYSNFLRCTERLMIPYKLGFSRKIHQGKSALEVDCVSHLRTFKREKYFEAEPLDPKIERAVDKDLIYKLEEVCTLRYIPKFLYYYRMRKQSVSHGDGFQKALNWHEIVRKNARERRKELKK